MEKEKKINFEMSDLQAIVPAPALNLPELTEEACYEPKDGSPYMVYFCKPHQRYSHGCPVCGSADIISNGVTQRRRCVHDIRVGLKQVDLLVSVPRYRCKDCGASFNHSFESIQEGHNVTTRLYEQIRSDAFSSPFVRVAEQYGYTEGTIRGIFDEYAAELERKRGPIVAPRVLGIDEKHILHRARGVFVDIETGRLLEMTESNKESDVVGAIESMAGYDTNIKIVTTDMANGYRSYVQYCLPNAKLIVDKFHVYQDLSRKIASTKTLIMAQIAERIASEKDPSKEERLRNVRDLLIHNAYLFKFGKKKLSESARRMAVMADVCLTFPELNHLRLIKQGFERIYEESTSRSDAERLYAEWRLLIPPNGQRAVAAWEAQYHVKAELYKDLQIFYRTTRKWYDEIFNYFDDGCQFTNAAAEGTNSLIQRINALGAGYGFKRLRAKSLFWDVASARTCYSIKTGSGITSDPVSENFADLENKRQIEEGGLCVQALSVLLLFLILRLGIPVNVPRCKRF